MPSRPETIETTAGKVGAELAPEWLRRSWDSARQAGLDQLSMEEIDAEIAAVRKERFAP